MYSKAKIMGHPIHPMLVAFPITFYTLTLIGFFIFQFVNQSLFWYQLAVFSNYAGVGTAILAAVPGFVDWAFGIPKNTSAKSRGLLHMALNVGALVLFIINLFLISGTWGVGRTSVQGPLLLSLIGVGLTMVAGYHGWELIARHKVGVELNAAQEKLEPDNVTGRRPTPLPRGT